VCERERERERERNADSVQHTTRSTDLFAIGIVLIPLDDG